MCFLEDFFCEMFSGDVRMMVRQLFSFDSDLFSYNVDDADKCERVEALSYNIRHTYPDRLVTYDAEEANEPRLIRFTDLTQSVLDMVEESCGKESKFRRSKSCDYMRYCDKRKCSRGATKCITRKRCKDSKIFMKSLLFKNSKKCEKRQCCVDKINCETRTVSPRNLECGNESLCTEQTEPNCENPAESQDRKPRCCIDICDSLKPFCTVDKLTSKQLAQLECCSRALHKLQVESKSQGGTTSATCIPADWDCLSSMQKFSFYWQALTGHKLRRIPYDNFKDVFSRRYQEEFPSNDVKQMRTAVRRCWRGLKTDERIPFNLHALLYAVSVGELDPSDHAAVRMFMSRWK